METSTGQLSEETHKWRHAPRGFLIGFGTLPGPGMVVANDLAGDDEEVTVAFEGQGVKRLMASYAKMEKG